MASIRLKNLTKRYDNDHVAVAGINLEVSHGEFLVLVGPSGCGKSSTLRMIAGLEEVTDGEIHIGDQCVNELDPGKRDIAMVFQNYALYPHMTVRQNMSFGLRMRKTAKAEIRQRVSEAAALLSIETLLNRRPAELSGGQRQRVAVGRAIVRQPSAFLFDEPLSNLDAKLRVQMRKELAELHHRLGTTTIYVTHDQVEAMTLGQRIVVMHEGTIQQAATPLEIYTRPANQFVASFIGSPAMNLIAGTLSQRDGKPWFKNPDIDYKVPLSNSSSDDSPSAKSSDQNVVLGFRPEHLTISDEHPKLADVTIDLVERMGDECLLYFALSGNSCVARLSGNVGAQRGDSLPLHLPKDRWHLFDSDGQGQRIVSGDE